MKRSTLLPFFALLAAACQDMPTQPIADEAASPPPAALAVALAPDQAVTLTASLEDATTRLLPALEDQGGAKQLGTHLQALSAHLAAGNRDGAERALKLAQSLLSRQSSKLGDAADLGSIQLVLDGADALLRGEGSGEQE